MSNLKGKKGGDALDAEKANASRVNRDYESKSVAIPSGAGDFSLKVDADMFKKVPIAHNLTIRITTGTSILMKLVSNTDGDTIRITPGAPYGAPFHEFEDIKFVKDGSNKTVEVVFA